MQHNQLIPSYITILLDAIGRNDEQTARDNLAKLVAQCSNLCSLYHLESPLFNLVLSKKQLELSLKLFSPYIFTKQYRASEPSEETMLAHPNTIFLTPVKTPFSNRLKINCFTNQIDDKEEALLSGFISADEDQQEGLERFLKNKNLDFLDLRLSDAEQNTALHVAALNDNPETAQLASQLVNTIFVNIDTCNTEGHTPLVIAVQQKNHQLVEQLAKLGARLIHVFPFMNDRILSASEITDDEEIKDILKRYGAGVENQNQQIARFDHLWESGSLLESDGLPLVSLYIQRCNEVISKDSQLLQAITLLRIKLKLLMQCKNVYSRHMLASVLSNVDHLSKLKSYLHVYHNIALGIGGPISEIPQCANDVVKLPIPVDIYLRQQGLLHVEVELATLKSHAMTLSQDLSSYGYCSFGGHVLMAVTSMTTLGLGLWVTIANLNNLINDNHDWKGYIGNVLLALPCLALLAAGAFLIYQHITYLIKSARMRWQTMHVLIGHFNQLSEQEQQFMGDNLTLHYWQATNYKSIEGSKAAVDQLITNVDDIYNKVREVNCDTDDVILGLSEANQTLNLKAFSQSRHRLLPPSKESEVRISIFDDDAEELSIADQLSNQDEVPLLKRDYV